MDKKISFTGKLIDTPKIRAGFIGCGSHAFRNIYPALQFCDVDLVAVCDLDLPKAQAFAKQFGAGSAYADYHEMLERETLDAVFVVVGYRKRPAYPAIALACLQAGVNVWIEKPPAASCAELETLRRVSVETGKLVGVGLKKMFFPANEKAMELTRRADFGRVSLASIQYPQYIPTKEEFDTYLHTEADVPPVMWFLDHLCHPASLMVALFGMPQTLYYERSAEGAGSALFTYADGPVVSLQLTHGASSNGGMERTLLVSDRGRHIVVDNNVRVSYHRGPSLSYGDEPDFFRGGTEEATAVWEPEFSLGQLYNKGLFLLGYYNELQEFASAVLGRRPMKKGTLEQALQVTRIFEKFAQGSGQRLTF